MATTIEDIEIWRKRQNLTKKALAAQLGITYTFLVDIMNGKRKLSDATAAKFERLRIVDAGKPCQFDDVRAFSVRLTPAEFNQLCRLAGVNELSLEDAEKVVRELLQRTWDTLAGQVDNIVDVGYEKGASADNNNDGPPKSVINTYKGIDEAPLLASESK